MKLDEETLRQRRAKLGANHAHTRESINFVADSYWRLGRFDEAEALYRESLGLKPDSLTATLGLARVLLQGAEHDTNNPARARERAEEGERFARDYLPKARIRHTNDPVELEKSLYEVAELRFRLHQYAEAEPLYHEILRSRRARLEADNPYVVESTASLGRLLADWAWAERTERGRSPSAATTNSQTGLELSKTLPSADVLRAGTSRAPQERAREAERLLRECLAAHLNGTNLTHWRVADVRSRLGGALVSVAVTDSALNATAREAKLAEAETLLLQGHQRLQESKSADNKYKRDALERLVRLYEAWGNPDQLAEWQQRLEEFDQPTAPSPAPAEQAKE